MAIGAPGFLSPPPFPSAFPLWTAPTDIGYLIAMNPEETMRRIELLRQEHRDLDSAITALGHSGAADQLQLARLKKRKLMLRDEIALLEDTLIPDIIA